MGGEPAAHFLPTSHQIGELILPCEHVPMRRRNPTKQVPEDPVNVIAPATMCNLLKIRADTSHHQAMDRSLGLNVEEGGQEAVAVREVQLLEHIHLRHFIDNHVPVTPVLNPRQQEEGRVRDEQYLAT